MTSSNVNKESNFNTPIRGPFHRPKDRIAVINGAGKIKTSGLGNFKKMLFAEGISKNAADFTTGARRQGSITH